MSVNTALLWSCVVVPAATTPVSPVSSPIICSVFLGILCVHSICSTYEHMCLLCVVLWLNGGQRRRTAGRTFPNAQRPEPQTAHTFLLYLFCVFFFHCAPSFFGMRATTRSRSCEAPTERNNAEQMRVRSPNAQKQRTHAALNHEQQTTTAVCIRRNFQPNPLALGLLCARLCVWFAVCVEFRKDSYSRAHTMGFGAFCACVQRS